MSSTPALSVAQPPGGRAGGSRSSPRRTDSSRVRSEKSPDSDTSAYHHATASIGSSAHPDQPTHREPDAGAPVRPLDQSEQLATARPVRTRVLHRSTTAESSSTAPMRVQTSSQLRDCRLTTSSWPRPPTPTTPRITADRIAHSSR
ncbi:hypothetical protein [Nocardioides marinisabuli]|uniref:hypothetical protein n=1 Tax=Nocardioides marinisabuli TaxID=419476 RepID=UPI002155378C|nr:hypothetical protein [Nocardioides marinisabuli]